MIAQAKAVRWVLKHKNVHAVCLCCKGGRDGETGVYVLLVVLVYQSPGLLLSNAPQHITALRLPRDIYIEQV
jgi:thiamine pyrophosphokinase